MNWRQKKKSCEKVKKILRESYSVLKSSDKDGNLENLGIKMYPNVSDDQFIEETTSQFVTSTETDYGESFTE